MRPHEKIVVDRACAIVNINRSEVVGPVRRRHRKAYIARRIIIASLYDPSTSRNYSYCQFRYGVAEIGRVLGCCHTTILYHVQDMGLANGKARP